MSKQPITHNDADRAGMLQEIQTQVSRLQMGYRDERAEFWALAVAWEALRFAWYVCAGEGGAEQKMASLQTAIADYEAWRLKNGG